MHTLHRCSSAFNIFYDLNPNGYSLTLLVQFMIYSQNFVSDSLCTGVLSDELSTVTDWYKLGMKLGVPDHKLDEIQRNHPHDGVSRWRDEVLSLWLRLTPNASWMNVIRALQRMGEKALAEKIRHKHFRGAPSRLFSTIFSVCNYPYI